MEFTTRIYTLTASFPKAEQFGLTNQIRRATVSIALNIAEGSGSGSTQEFLRFLTISKRSAYEVISGLEIAKNLNYGNSKDIELLIREAEEICSMVVGLSRKLKL